jgi:predicted ATPase
VAGGLWLDDARSALNWAFSATGDVAIGVALTAAAIPMGMHLSLLDECRLCVERAVASGTAEHGHNAAIEKQRLCWKDVI